MRTKLISLRIATLGMLLLAGAVLTALTSELPEGDDAFAFAVWLCFAAVSLVTIVAVVASSLDDEEEDR